jgi:hypothetical protein
MGMNGGTKFTVGVVIACVLALALVPFVALPMLALAWLLFALSGA